MINRHTGEPDVFELADLPTPTPQAGEVLVRVHAASVNPVDFKQRRSNGFQYPFPIILGWDVAGTVEAVGEGVTRLKVGDAVFGMVRFPKQGRAYAEYVTAPETDLAVKPEGMSFTDAAATTLAALTARQALEHMNLQAGQTLLVQAAAGGVGHYAVQLAKARGARVIGTASGANRDFVLGLGADEFVDYTAGPFEDAVGQVDAVLDAVGGETFTRSYAVVKPGGWLVTIAATLKPAEAPRTDIHAERILVKPSHTDLELLARLFEAGQLRPHVSRTFPLEQVADAHRLLEDRHVVGKVVLDVG